MDALEIISLMNEADMEVISKVKSEITSIAAAVELVTKRLKSGGRLDAVPGANILEKKNLVLNTGGSLPDVFFKVDMSSLELTRYGSQGLIVPLNDLIEEYAPETYTINDGKASFTDLVKKNPDGLSLNDVLGKYVVWGGGANPSVAGDKYFRRSIDR